MPSAFLTYSWHVPLKVSWLNHKIKWPLAEYPVLKLERSIFLLLDVSQILIVTTTLLLENAKQNVEDILMNKMSLVQGDVCYVQIPDAINVIMAPTGCYALIATPSATSHLYRETVVVKKDIIPPCHIAWLVPVNTLDAPVVNTMITPSELCASIWLTIVVISVIHHPVIP